MDIIRQIICKWFGITFERCPNCVQLKAMLEREMHERKQMTETLLSLVKPEVQQVSPTPHVIQPLRQGIKGWQQQRQILEQEDAHRAKVAMAAEIERVNLELAAMKEKPDASKVGEAV